MLLRPVINPMMTSLNPEEKYPMLSEKMAGIPAYYNTSNVRRI